MPKSAPKFCRGGHRQRVNWTESHGCDSCDRASIIADEREAANAAHRSRKLAELGPIPRTMELRETSTGRLVQLFTVGRQPRRRRRR